MALKQSTSAARSFVAIDSTGAAVTGVADGSWTKKIAKNGGALGSMTVTITEDAFGRYTYTLSTSHTDTIGELHLQFQASGVVGNMVNERFDVEANKTDDIAALLPALDVSGFMKCQVKGMDANTVTSTAIATDAIAAAGVKADAVTKISAGVLDVATSAHTTSGTIGKAIGDTVGFGAPPSASTVAGAVADVTLASHTGAGSLSATLAAAATASALASDDSAILAAITSATSPLATGSALTSAVSTIAGDITTATSPLATAAGLTSAVSTLAGDITSATSGLATASALSTLSSALGSDLTTILAAIPSASTVAAAVLGVTVYGSRTLKGILRRLHAVLVLKAAGLQAAATTGTFYDEDGTTKLVEATIDNVAGTRATPSTLAGD